MCCEASVGLLCVIDVSDTPSVGGLVLESQRAVLYTEAKTKHEEVLPEIDLLFCGTTMEFRRELALRRHPPGGVRKEMTQARVNFHTTNL